ncbi:hypothetical protein GS462_24410 [Rhodococcus hoagii]|nr:hypothetical protein [Prescottella equi]
MTADGRDREPEAGDGDVEPVEMRNAKIRTSRRGAFGLMGGEHATVRVPADTAAMWDERYWRARP